MRLIDTHAHLDFPDYESDLDQVIERARAAGIDRIVTIGTDLASHEKNEAVVRRYENVSQAVGLHPTDSKEFTGAETVSHLRKFATPGTRVVAIGEIGLDYYRNPTDEDKRRQEEQFRSQLALARELALPISLHSRAAEEECLRIIREEISAKPFWGGVAHCWAGPVKEAYALIDFGFFISISGIVTFPNAPEVRALAQHIPLDRLVLETDAPFLSPDRGKRNEPAAVLRIAQAVAEIREIPVEEVARVTTENAERVFKL
jgi:TatD DNase family protein